MTLMTLIPTALLTAVALPVEDSIEQQAARGVPVRAADTGTDDARRAAAARLLDISRFRERQAVTVRESIRAAQADLASECIDRAAEGRTLGECRSTAKLDAPTTARLTSSEPRLLDEVMVASQTVYARNFTATEMDEITRFFKTPVGQKYSRLYPQMLTDVTARKLTIARRYLIEATRAPTRRTTP